MGMEDESMMSYEGVDDGPHMEDSNVRYQEPLSHFTDKYFSSKHSTFEILMHFCVPVNVRIVSLLHLSYGSFEESHSQMQASARGNAEDDGISEEEEDEEEDDAHSKTPAPHSQVHLSEAYILLTLYLLCGSNNI